MRVQLLTQVGQPLVAAEIATPVPERGQVLVKVAARAACRTDLHVVDGELPIRNCPSFQATRSSARSLPPTPASGALGSETVSGYRGSAGLAASANAAAAGAKT